ncbi:MAG: site-specific integrase [SAR86 cluster bacterium]|nr:site-specific integrase [SAR86 cluster bacterium]
MKKTHLVPRKYGSQRYFHFRGCVPQDLISIFSGRKQFQISLKNVRNVETLLVSTSLITLTEQLFNDIRKGMKTLTLEDIKEILKVEVRKSILHSHHVHLGTNPFNPEEREESLESVSLREVKFKHEIYEDLLGYEKSLDIKMEGILQSLGIEYNTNSVNYKQLRRSFVKLYLLRYDWIKDLIKETGRTDDDFRLEVEEKLKISLFPELSNQPTQQVLSVPTPTSTEIETSNQLTKHQNIPLSVVIEKFIDEKGSIRTTSVKEIRHSLTLLIEEFGDIPIGGMRREMTSKFKGHIMKIPRNRNKNPQYRDLDFHKLVELNVKDVISTTTVNKHLSWCSSFYEWSINHGYSNINPFKGLKLKRKVSPKDERDRFSEKDLKKIFQKENYIHFTNIEKGRYELYWVPLIGVFSGLRLGEITSLYLSNIREIGGNHRNKRWCFDILEEPNRPDKHLKTLSSRRIVPIHETLLKLGLIEFIELLKKKDPNRERLFQELPYREGNYNQNVSRFFNYRYLPNLGLKTDKKNFHSFRHTVIDHLKQKGVEPHFVNELLGHSSGNIDLDRYGKGYNPDIIYNKCVKKILYQTSSNRPVDFLQLQVNWEGIIE